MPGIVIRPLDRLIALGDGLNLGVIMGDLLIKVAQFLEQDR